MNLHEQRVVILGGTSGIGLATASAAADQGAQVTVVSGRQASVDRALAELPSGVQGFAADLTDPGPVQEVFAKIGEFEHLIYTAGDPLQLARVEDLDIDGARQFFGVRYFGVLSAIRAARPHLRADGSITLTTGIAAIRPQPGWSVAASICGAVESLTRALALELAPIRVNAVSPGPIRTPLWGPDSEQFLRDTAASVPLRRVGSPEDTARAYLYLLSQPFSTGTVLTLDGGAALA